MSSVKITKLELTLQDGEKIYYTIEEAKELYEQLHEIFGRNTYIGVPTTPNIKPATYPWHDITYISKVTS